MSGAICFSCRHYDPNPDLAGDLPEVYGLCRWPLPEATGGGTTLAALHAANIARQAEWCPDQVPDLSFRGNELGGECGEAQNVIKKLERERHGWRGSRATLDDLAQELADVVICADLCAVTAGIDLDAAVVAKFNVTSAKVGLTTMLAARPDPSSDGTGGSGWGNSSLTAENQDRLSLTDPASVRGNAPSDPAAGVDMAGLSAAELATHLDEMATATGAEAARLEATGENSAYWAGKRDAYRRSAGLVRFVPRTPATAGVDREAVARARKIGARWTPVRPDAVCGGSDAQARNVFAEVLADIFELSAIIAAAPAGGDGFQARNAAWMAQCFDGDPTDLAERRDRFLEESLELGQAFAGTREDAHRLVDYVFDRPPGLAPSEFGGMLTTAACLAAFTGWDMAACGEAELARVSEPAFIARLRGKRAMRHGRGPLPGYSAPGTSEPTDPPSPIPQPDPAARAEASAREGR